jgi:hypothetical protein
MLFGPSSGASPEAYQPIQLLVLRRFDGAEYVNVTDEPSANEVAEADKAGAVVAEGAVVTAAAAAVVSSAYAAELPCSEPNAARAITATDTPRTLMPRRFLRWAPRGRNAMVPEPSIH